MNNDLSPEQRAVVARPLTPLAVTACAGSGKTKTAVHRLAAVRRKYTERGLVALLSFSNVAVDTFRAEYSKLSRDLTAPGQGFDVEIDTMDGFITTNVLRPHGHRLMKSPRVPFLVEGREAFLKNYTVFDGQKSRPVADIEIAWDGASFCFTAGRGAKVLLKQRVEQALAKLAATGAYTHAMARYWVLRVLREEAFVLRALARRFRHIVVDEAQDIGPEHQAILELLIEGGSQVSLIGDTNQGIYEFARADGEFLRSYGEREEVESHRLTVNYRSVPGIVGIANSLTGADDTASRDAASEKPAAYFISFRTGEREKTLASFRSLLVAADIDVRRGVVLCRSAPLTAEMAGEKGAQGVGTIRCFADAAISRDQAKDFHKAFTHFSVGLVGLLAPKHGGLASQLNYPNDETMRRLRRLIWSFLRNSEAGLPSSNLAADTEWHPVLCERVRALLKRIESEYEFTLANNLGQRLAKKQLENRPLFELPDLAGDEAISFRTSTVHRAKGESLEAVLYVAKKAHVRAFLDGAYTEEGRIGYVALTRARNLFVLAVPEPTLEEFRAELEAIGITSATLT